MKTNYRLFSGLYAAIIGLLLSFGLINSAPASDDQQTMRASGAVVPVRRQMPVLRSNAIFSVGESIRFLFVAEDRPAFA